MTFAASANRKAKAQGVRFGPKPILTAEVVQKVKELRADGPSSRHNQYLAAGNCDAEGLGERYGSMLSHAIYWG
jgi:hypothetical protein